MPNNAKLEMPQTQAPNNEWQDLQWSFNGSWMPDEDPALIGPENYTSLQNLRYTNTSVEGVNGYSKYNTTPIATYTKLRSGIQLRGNTNITYPSEILVQAINNAGQGRVLRNRTAVSSQGDFISAVTGATLDGAFDVNGNYYYADSAVNLKGRFSEGPQGSVAYCNSRESMIYQGEEQRISACFITDNVVESSATVIKDRTEVASISTQTESVTIDATNYLIICSTNPIHGMKFYVKTANVAASTLTVQYWNGSAFAAVVDKVDNTISGGVSLAKTGKVMFDHTDAVAKPRHYQELYLYQYYVKLSAGTAEVYYITLDMGFQSIKDVWDGVYRQPIQFQKLASGIWSDYTLYVNEPSSDLSSPIGAELDDMGGGTFPVAGQDHIEIMFDEPVSGIKWTMVTGEVNVNASAMTIYYWDGEDWQDTGVVVATDGTSTGGATLAKTGLVYWTPPTDEEKVTKFGVTGYVYGIKLGSAVSADVIVDIITGIPAQQIVQPFAWSAMFNNRLMLGNFQEGKEANRMDFSVANAPSVWNGFESSSNGLQSLYFGGDEPIRAGVQLYNRFGASVYSMFLVFKDSELYLVVGESPDDFVIYPVSRTVGCPAPYSIATAELGINVGEDVARNVAIWLSNSGPMMFDGATISKVEGINKYFEQGDTSEINWALLGDARGWFDQVYKEYNILIPSASASSNDLWLVYDLRRKKWFQKDTGTADDIQSAFNCVDTTGEPYVFAGTDTGQIYKLEQGTNWDGVGITQRLRTGDFWPSKNIWDETLIRKFKVVCKKIADSASNDLSIYYYQNTYEDSGAGVLFQDSDSPSGIFVDFLDTEDVVWAAATASTFQLSLDIGLQRLTRLIQDLNYRGWAHAFEFQITTTDVVRGWQPIFWGIQYRVERKDNTATQ